MKAGILQGGKKVKVPGAGQQQVVQQAAAPVNPEPVLSKVQVSLQLDVVADSLQKLDLHKLVLQSSQTYESAQKLFAAFMTQLIAHHKGVDDDEKDYLTNVNLLCVALQEAAEFAEGGPGTAKKSALAVMTGLAVKSKRVFVHVPSSKRELRHTIALHTFYVVQVAQHMTQYGLFVYWQSHPRMIAIHGLKQGPTTANLVLEHYSSLGSERQNALQQLLAKSFSGQAPPNESLRQKCEAYVQQLQEVDQEELTCYCADTTKPALVQLPKCSHLVHRECLT